MSPGRIAAAVVAVFLAAGALYRRERLSRERLIGLLVVAAALGIYASGLLSALDPKKLIVDVAQALGPWTYALVGVFAYLETAAFVGLVAPGETIVLAGGVIAGQGEIELIPLIGVVWACAVLGDTTSFFIGRRLGRGFLIRHGPKVGIGEERLGQVDRYFQRHGGATVLIGRFIGLVRALAPFTAGSSGLSYKRFIPFSIVGTGLWGSALCVLGYLFWRSFDQVAAIAGHALFAFGVVAGVVVAVVVAYRRLREPEERRRLAAWVERQGERPVLRPLFAAARPVWRLIGPRVRFIWKRLTPGALGLELTTSLAVAGVGIYVFVLYTVVVAGDPGPTALDSDAFDLVDHLQSSTGVDVAKVVAGLGSLPAVGGIVLVTAALLLIRRRSMELAALLGGFALLFVAVHVAKAGVDRPRPPDPLAGTSGSSFPSSHAAYSAAWVAVALAFTRRLGIFRRAALVLAAILISAAIGVSRIYLRVHFWSDVAGGWGLGYGIFGAVAVVALVVAYMRHNEREATPSKR